MNARDFESALQAALDVAQDEDDFPLRRTATFEEGGVLTMNRGLTIYMEDGSEFQLTIVRSALPDDYDYGMADDDDESEDA